MAKIKLSEGGFTPIPEGEHIFKITKSTYDEDFGSSKSKWSRNRDKSMSKDFI